MARFLLLIRVYGSEVSGLLYPETMDGVLVLHDIGCSGKRHSEGLMRIYLTSLIYDFDTCYLCVCGRSSSILPGPHLKTLVPRK